MKSINFHKGYVFIIFNFCILTNSIAVAGVHKLSFKQLTIDEGLSGNTVNCITKDSEGLIWIGTDYGLNCYDGYSFKIYLNDPTDKTSISDNVVTEIYEDKTGILWVGVYGGINIFDKYTREFNNFALSIKTRKGDFIARYINTITEDPNGNIWVCTEIGLFIINPLTMQYEYFGIDNTNIKSNYFNYLCFGKSQNYIFNSKAIYTLIPEKKIFKELISVNTNISSMITFGDSLWITTNNEGVLTYKIDGVSLKKAVSNHKINIPAVKCCSNDDGLMYFASLTEIIAYHPLKNEVSRQSIEKEDRINLDKINSFYLDNQGILWIGKKGEGLLYTSPYLKKIEHYTLNDKTEFDFVTAFAEDTRSNLWVGEWDNGITNFNHANNTKINYKNIPGVPSSLSNNLVRDIYKDTNGRLWIATENGINCKLPGSKGFVRYLNMPVNQVGVYSIFEDSKNNIWIGTLGKGIMRYNARDDKFYPFLDSSLVYIDSNPKTYAFITCVAEDSAGCLWLGTYRGLAYLDVNNKTIQIYNKNSTSVQSLIINCILFDSRNRLWAGTSKGLLLFSNNNKKSTFFTKNHGIPNDNISGILEDNHGNLWLSTKGGICSFKPGGKKQVDPLDIDVKIYDNDDGLQSKEFISRSYLKDSDGYLYFGGIKGFNRFHPDSIVENPHVPPVIITDFLLFNNPVPIKSQIIQIDEEKRLRKNNSVSPEYCLDKHIMYSEKLILKHNQNYITLKYAALNYINPEKNKYAYILDGIDREWNNVGTKKEVTYNQLPPGDYVFKVRASNNDGVWNNTGTQLEITILPPYYQTWAFRILLILIIVTIVFKLYRRRIKLIEKRNKELEKKVRERTESLHMANSELSQKNEELQTMSERLHEADQNKTKFFMNISHEFRTPLTLIADPIRTLFDDKRLPPDVLSKHKLIYRNANRLLRLINQLLDLRKFETHSMKLHVVELDIEETIKNHVESFQYLAERHDIDFHFVTQNQQEHYSKLYFDPDIIEKIIYNLLSNAFKFTPDGGEIIVELRFLTDNNKKPKVLIRISDSGIGIAPEKITYIFDRFYRIEKSNLRKENGTGIGLSLTKELVELHQGKITVESTIGKGSIFTVIIPCDRSHYPKEAIGNTITTYETEKYPHITAPLYNENIQEVIPEESFENIENLNTLLIIDDNPDIIIYIRQVFQHEYYIYQAKNGQEGLNLATEKIPDVIISDVMMPVMDGITLCGKLKTNELTSHIPIILLTAKAAEENCIEGLKTGADDYIVKPFNNEILAARVKNLIVSRKKLKNHYQTSSVENIHTLPFSDIDRTFLEKLAKIVSKNLSNPDFDVKLFSQETGVSTMHLYRKLKALTNLAPSEFIQDIRLKKSASLLRTSNKNVSEIAYLTGFKDPSHFSKLFKKKYNTTPSLYRKPVAN